MQLRTLLKQVLATVVLIGVLFSIVFISIYFLESLDHRNSKPLNTKSVVLLGQENINSNLPVRIKIPTINVDAALESAGLTSQGAMDVSKDPSNAAWFNGGPHPGENGSAVIAGHYGWKDGIPAVFDNLHKLQKGDKLYVQDAKGVSATFVVRELQTYDQNENALDIFTSSDGKAHLNLITCEGIWNKGEQSYSSRLIVFTDKE